MYRFTTSLVLCILLGSCGGGGGSGGEDGGDTTDGGDLPVWPEDRLLQVDSITLEGGTGEPATVQVDGNTVAEESTSFQARYAPADLGLPATYGGGERPAPVRFDLQATDRAAQSTSARVEVALEP